MTQSAPPVRVALALAAAGVPVLPLRHGKVPVGNCAACTRNACGGRPNMKTSGPCTCPAPCHAWAAATTDPAVLASPAWASAWREAVGVGYHPGGARLTVVDLDTPAAVAWAQGNLPPTRTVTTARGQHWIYQGTMPSGNAVRPGIDIKSRSQYARWLGPGTGRMMVLPSVVRALSARKEATPPPGAGVASSVRERAAWDRTVATGCRHTDAYVRTGLERGLAKIREHTESGAGSQAFGVARFLAAQHTACPGPCGLDVLAAFIVDTTVCVGVPADYAERAVTNGLAEGSGRTA